MAIDLNCQSKIVCTNPANRQVLAEIAVTAQAEIEQKVRQAHAAQARWSATPLAVRLSTVERFRRLLFERREEIGRWITAETGKPLVEALVAEIFGVLETCVWLRRNAQAILAPRAVQLNALFLPGKRAYNVFEPLGVVAVVSPWNYPFSIPVTTILSALTAGNAVVWKPSPRCALVAQRSVALLHEAGFPADLVSVVQGDRLEAETLIGSDVQRVMFTGSTAGGKAIMAMAAEKLLPLTLELGGKHPAVVLADSDIIAIARPLAWAAFTNGGQACASIERLYVVSGIKEALTEALVNETRRLRLGNGLETTTDIGPLIDEGQVLRVEQQVKEAVQQGASLLCGGNTRFDLGGNFFEPTVLGDVRHGMRVVEEEIFGPVLPIIEVSDEAEAVLLANQSSLGLGASIWTADTERGERLARQLTAGMVWINDGLYTHISPDAPWGGVKESGFGRMHSAHELRDLVYVKNIGVNKQQPQVWNFPYGPTALEYIRGGIEVVHGAASSKLHAMRKVGAALRQLKKG